MGRLYLVEQSDWNSPPNVETARGAPEALEAGQTLYFPRLAFRLSEAEGRYFTPDILTRAKNVSYDPSTDRLGGTVCRGADADTLKDLLRRYADAARGLLRRLLKPYAPALIRQRTSLRPAEIEGRVSTPRKDDTRLHVDSFPSMPVRGQRILRLFCNINPHGRARTWRLGEPFPEVARRFWPRLPAPGRINAHVLHWIRVTKGLRSEYDHYMLQLHDAMKADDSYQRNAEQETVAFPPGSCWACFTDQVSHAAMAGQHQLEQTFSLPVEAMLDPATAPLSVLERLAGRPLAPRSLRRAA